MTPQSSSERAFLASRETLFNYALDYPPTAQELELRLLANRARSSSDGQQKLRRRKSEASSLAAMYNLPLRHMLSADEPTIAAFPTKNTPINHRDSKDELRRLSHQMILSHSYGSLLCRLQRQRSLRKGYLLAFNGVGDRRSPCIPSSISDRRVSFTFTHRHPEQPSGQTHCRPISPSEPIMRIRSMYAKQARRYASEVTVDNSLTDDKRKGFCASASAMNGDWELELIEGLIFEDLDVHERGRKSKVWLPANPPMISPTPHEQFSVEKLPLQQVLRTVKAEPEVVDIECPRIALQIQQVDVPPTLKIVQAVAVTEEVLDDISPIDDGADHYPDNEPVSPMSDQADHEEPVSPISSEAMRLISFEDISEIKLDTGNWPFPKAEQEPEPEPEPEPELAPEPQSQYSYLLNLSSHPQPLRSNPTHTPIIHKSLSAASLTSAPVQLPPTIHRKPSTSSLRSNRNRRAVIIQGNDSSLSLHSQGMITDMSTMGNSWLAPSSAAASASTHSIRDNRRFSGILHLNKANAVVHTSHSPLRGKAQAVNGRTTTGLPQNQQAHRSRPAPRGHFRNTSLALLTPVSETFEKLTARRESAVPRPSIDGSRRPSSFSIISGDVGVVGNGEEGKKKKKVKEKRDRLLFGGFNGALVGHSRRAGFQM